MVRKQLQKTGITIKRIRRDKSIRVKCHVCGNYRVVRTKSDSIDGYEKRRPSCRACGYKQRMVTLGGHSATWKGGRIIDTKGYIRVWKKGVGYLKEHRYVWEESFGPIPSEHVIHHIDGDKQNNNITNLICLTKKEHDKLHAPFRRKKCQTQ